jgi:hypothetical protein
MILVPPHLANRFVLDKPRQLRARRHGGTIAKAVAPMHEGKATSGVLSWQLLGQPQGALKLLIVAFSPFSPQLRIVDCEPQLADQCPPQPFRGLLMATTALVSLQQLRSISPFPLSPSLPRSAR